MIPRWRLMLKFFAVFPFVGAGLGLGGSLLYESNYPSFFPMLAAMRVLGTMFLGGSIGLMIGWIFFMCWRDDCRNPDELVPYHSKPVWEDEEVP